MSYQLDVKQIFRPIMENVDNLGENREIYKQLLTTKAWHNSFWISYAHIHRVISDWFSQYVEHVDKLWIMGKTHVTLRYVNYFY